MHNLIETALFKARAASDRAEAHMDFADMLHSAGLYTLAQSRKSASVSESRMAQVYYAMASEIAV